jgi:hypothetical protein
LPLLGGGKRLFCYGSATPVRHNEGATAPRSFARSELPSPMCDGRARGSMRARRSATSLALAAPCVVVAALLPEDARAFCREVNVTPPAGYDPAATGCYYPSTNPQNGGHVVELYWKSLCVGYSLQESAQADT